MQSEVIRYSSRAAAITSGSSSGDPVPRPTTGTLVTPPRSTTRERACTHHGRSRAIAYHSNTETTSWGPQPLSTTLGPDEGALAAGLEANAVEDLEANAVEELEAKGAVEVQGALEGDSAGT